MTEPKVLLTTLYEATSAADRPYLRGRLGASRILGFPTDSDDGQRQWRLYLVEISEPKPTTERIGPAASHRQRAETMFTKKP